MKNYNQHKNVYQASLERIDFIFKNFSRIYVSFSGGKDSTFTLWYIVTQKKLKPLVVRFDHGFYRNNLQEKVSDHPHF